MEPIVQFTGLVNINSVNVCKISLCIPTMNRFDSFLKEYIPRYLSYLKKNIIDELVICDENGEDFEKITRQFSEELTAYPTFRVYKNEAVLGVFQNKIKVSSLASFEFVAIMDSDNFADASYFISAKQYITTNKFNKHSIFAPSFAKPTFDFKPFSNLIVTKHNLRDYYSASKFDILLNTGNYVVSKHIFDEIRYDSRIMFYISACDVLFFNLLCFQQFEDFQIHILKDMEYTHVVHGGSIYTNTISNCREFINRVVLPGYDKLMGI
jgi:hypothetical protein